jgi:hypothetical protein
LDGHQDTRVAVEKDPIFKWVKEMSINPQSRELLFPKLIDAYRFEIARTTRPFFVDKSHPNIWLADVLADALAGSLFLGIVRNPFAVVSSMLKHKDVLKWIENWRDYPIPNNFLGITEANVSQYDALPLSAKCALRWMSHLERMNELKSELGDRLLVVQYENFVSETDEILSQIEGFLGMKTPIPVPKIKHESLSKWRSNLSENDLHAIEDIVGFSVNNDILMSQ